MSNKSSAIIKEMIHFEEGDPHRINHFLKVYGFAKSIGELEGIDDSTQYILEIASIMHDIGIKISLEKYGSAEGYYQELEGPPKSREILERHNFDGQLIDRVCFLIGQHHSYNNIDGIDHQILIEADFLVNIYEGQMIKEQIASIERNIFRTKTGLDYLQKMFL